MSEWLLMAACVAPLACIGLALWRPGAAMLVSLLAGGIVLALADLYGGTSYTPSTLERLMPLAAIAGPVCTSVVVVLVKPRPGRDNWARTLAIWWWLSMAMGLTAFVLGMVLPGPFPLFLTIMLIVAVAFGLRFLVQNRHDRDLETLSLIAAAVRQHLPLPDALVAEARRAGGPRGRTFYRLGERLSEGLPLPAAIRDAWPQCPAAALTLIDAGHRSNQLPEALDAAEEELRRHATGDDPSDLGRGMYILLLLGLMVPVLGGISVFVIPRFAKIFSDLHALLPAPTMLLIGISQQTHAPVLIILPLVFFLLLPLFIHTRLRPRKVGGFYALSALGDWLKWHVPLSRHIERNAAQARAAEAIRLGLRAGLPLDAAIEQAAGQDMNYFFALRVQSWLKRVRDGDPVADAARDCRVGPVLTWALDPEMRHRDPAGTLEVLSEIFRGRAEYHRHLLRSTAWPAMTIAWGLVVGFVVVALFLPLVALIHSSSEGVMP